MDRKELLSLTKRGYQKAEVKKVLKEVYHNDIPEEIICALSSHSLPVLFDEKRKQDTLNQRGVKC